MQYTLEKAQFLLGLPSLEDAEHYATNWIQASPNSFEALQFCGLLFAKQKKMLDALHFFTKALEQAPQHVSTYTNLSNVYLALGDIEAALKYVYQALRLQPHHAESYNNLGRLFYKQGRIENAIPNFEKALRIEPNYWEAHYNLAHSLASLNQMNRAASHYREVIRIFPEHPVAHYNLALTYIEDENYSLAEDHLSKALTLDPTHATAANLLGEVYVTLGKIADAISLYEKTIELCPTMESAHHNIAILHLRNDNPEKALSHFTQALDLDPKNDTARHMMIALNHSQNSATAPTAYIANLFDQYAEYYNEHLKTQLNYQVPFLLRSAIGRCLGSRSKALRILDLGCGTGLCGIVFRDLALDLIGIDLSPKMIEKATQLNTYEKLLVAELNEYLSAPTLETFDLIIAGDVMVYSGDLSALFKNIEKALVPEGRFAFTTEYLSAGTYALQTTGRFAHANAYIEALATRHHFSIELAEDIVPRQHLDLPIRGRLYVLKLLLQ